jgi:hypothetical protein
LNQTKGYWLLLDVLFVAFSIFSRLHKDCQAQASRNPLLMCGKFEAKLEIMHGKMGLEVINVLEPFLAFSMTINVIVALIVIYNMCVFYLDPRFKGL